MIRKMTQLTMFAMLMLSLLAFTAAAQKKEQPVPKEAAKKESTEIAKKGSTGATKKESAAPEKKTAAPQSAPTKESAQRPTLTITDVTKRDSAGASLKGQNRTVQVDAKMKVTLPPGAKLKVVEWILTTVNSDGSTSRGAKTWNAGNIADQQLLTCTIDLPMAGGIVAERFTLSATAEILHEGVSKKITTSKSGIFAK